MNLFGNKAKKDIIFLIGPTASGKSLLAVQLAEILRCEIISVDSMAIYRGMDIGTAKPSSEEKQKIPHHLIDISTPKDNYSVVEFCNAVCETIDKIRANGNIPLLVGGTMFYFHSLLYGISPAPSADLKLRSIINDVRNKLGNEALYEWLKKIDPESATHIHKNDTQRLQRALEICLKSGKRVGEMHPRQPFLPNQNIRILALNFAHRHILHQRIEKRFDQMLKDGMCEEVTNLLLSQRIDSQSNAIRAVGYHQIWQYLMGEIDYEKMRNQAIYASRQLAKRQLTWMRQMPINHSYFVDQITQKELLLQCVKVLS